jgi:hypothetical protein
LCLDGGAEDADQPLRRDIVLAEEKMLDLSTSHA